MIDVTKLKENGASDAQINKVKEIYPKLVKSKYTATSLWCNNGKVGIYLDSGYISIANNGDIVISYKFKFFTNRIKEIIN